MNTLFFYAGHHPIHVGGATRTIAQNLFASYPADQPSYLVSVNQLSLHPPSLRREFDIQTALKQKMLPWRAAKKMLQLFRIKSQAPSRWFERRMVAQGDALAASIAQSLETNSAAPTLLMGFGSMSYALGRYAKSMNTPFAIHCQWCHPHQQVRWLEQAYSQIGERQQVVSAWQCERRLAEIEMADQIWCPSNLVKDSLLQQGVDASKLFVVHPGIDLERFQQNGRAPSSRFKLVFVGGVCVQKGVIILLDALRRIRYTDVEVVLNGAVEPAVLDWLTTVQPELRQKRIEVVIDPGDPVRHLSDASAFVLPSMHDAFGIVVLEAMAAGLPVITSNQTGAKDLVEEGANGFVVPAGDADALADKIETLYEDGELRRRMGQRSSETARRFSVGRQSALLLSQLGIQPKTQ